jgi:hypothetical protein
MWKGLEAVETTGRVVVGLLVLPYRVLVAMRIQRMWNAEAVVGLRKEKQEGLEW